MGKRYLGLKQRGNIWYVRKRVPDAIRDIIGMSEVVISLRTRDHKLAQESYWSVCADIENDFAKARRKLNTNKLVTISELQAEQFARKWFADTFENLEDNARAPISDVDRDDYLSDLGDRYKIYSSTVDEVVQPYLQSEANSLLIENGFSAKTDQVELAPNFDTSTKGYWRLLELIRRGNLEAIRQQGEIIYGDDHGDQFFANPDRHTDVTERSFKSIDDITLGEMVNKYLDARNFDNNDRTRKDLVAAFRVLTEIVGETKSLNALTYDDFSDVFTVLKQLPPNFAKGNQRKNKSLILIAEKAKKSGNGTLSAVSINKYMNRISAMMDWAVETGHTKANYASNKLLRPVKKLGENEKEARHPFSIEELNSIFRADLYVNPKVEVPSLYWVPLIALFQGMRMEEILQLTVDDVQEEGGVRFFRLHREGQNHLKNANANRNVPIHPVIWKLGFDTLLNKAERQPDSRLFFDASRGASGRFSSVFTRKFSRHLAKIGVKKPKISFHSFRHNFRDAGRNCQIPEDRVLQLAGWSSGKGTHTIYGSGINLVELNKAIEQVNYDGLDLGTIKVIDWISGTEKS